MLNLELKWEQDQRPQPGLSVIEAVGSGPADESVIVAEWFVRPGQTVSRGDAVAALEATKSVFELTSPLSGVIEELCAEEGATVPVGAPLAKVRTSETGQRPRPVVQENPGKPILRRLDSRETLHLPRANTRPRAFDVGISSIAEVEEEMIRATLRDKNGNRRDTARVLGISERTLYRKMEKYDIR